MNFFGVNSPLRLLRTRWTDPAALAQELYAMFTAKGPVEIEDTVTIKVPEGQPALRLMRDRATPAEAAVTTQHVLNKTKEGTAPDRTRRARPIDVDLARRPGGWFEPAESRRPAPDFGGPEPATAPLLEIDGGVEFTGDEPVRFRRDPKVFNPMTGQYVDTDLKRIALRFEAIEGALFGSGDGLYPRIADPNRGGGGGGFFGVVVEGRGNAYKVALHENGPDQPASRVVDVGVPMIDAGEAIDEGTWIGPILKTSSGKYFYQPAVWLP